MRFKEDFIKELSKRLKENLDIVESAFYIANIKFDKSRIFNIQPMKHQLTLLVDDDPYVFFNKLIYCILNKQELRVSTKNVACDLLFNMVNLILDEFSVERIDKIGD